MIRFGVVASVVTGAVALLIVGALSGDLALVYLSIGLAALALVLLVIGVAVWRDQVFAGTTPAGGPQVAADQRARPHPSPVPGAPAQAGSLQGDRSAPVEDRRARSAAAQGWPARPAREPVAQSGSGRQRPVAPGRPGRQRDTVPADWAGPEPSAAGGVGHGAGPEHRPEREVRPSARRAPRKPGSAEPQPAERAGAAEQSARWPGSAESHPSVEHPEPADDPTRLAHKLGIGRQAGPDTDSPAGSRMRPEQAAESGRAAEKEPAPPASGPATAGRPEAAAEPAAPGPGEAVPTATAGASASTAAAEDAAGPTPASPEAATDDAASRAVQDGTPAETEVLVVPGIARYHQADCILIRFLGEDDLQRMSRQQADAAGCAACRACRP